MSKKEATKENSMENLIALCKRRGFVYQGSEIYGGLAGVYDFGPRGVELLNNIKASWWKANVYDKENYYGLDSGMFKHPRVWEASGHTKGFVDPMAECRKCNTRIRVDKELAKIGVAADEKMSEKDLNDLFDAHRNEMVCPSCGKKDFTAVRAFNLLVKTNLGDFTSAGSEPVYLPGEACQGIYLNFKNIVDTLQPSIPFGVAQMGKAFRNEISPRNFLFRTREFEQADTQFFVRPNENKEAYEAIKKDRWQWYLSLGIDEEKLRFKQHEHLVFYAKDAWDIEYDFPTFGFDEIEGIHDRTDYDLTQHMKFSGIDLRYTDPKTVEKYIPWILETSMGLGRVFLAVMADAYHEDELGGKTRVVLRLSPKLAPVKIAVFPLLKNKPQLVEKASEIYTTLKKEFGAVVFDDNGNIGKRYRRQDEIGTPFCVTVDFETIEKHAGVTVRDRDTGGQERVSEKELVDKLRVSMV
ncbi:MAG: glycine--tRNA ligase [Candidatus Taylorbacteria bacterium RIFCSPHIGHO2_01_FULL_44_110]|uniref:glycine--tRNA ligase n=1 Tax=Candidatus Taylorbacteria bacterium RIFCSPHIGHO2_12_FULL_45_16 TaxID=1802315 RepID=A0A1G2MYA4_9BACT|nr:MAG: glycine--tRNA ligase [Candidatus Taylorbacteria bacterium RIFCSPHIGHO2_01_FULL_44_110]OHA28814.1 MAG: glycine--tRNA ligase [Candidatus Taylorbacteria bacterium RIFCSPHIGHO2_12_FULL_45_16]OHA32873.1 MAG: glycine--tRNA ligase [Candidatus Taylorbacteria bacterium RIFCSPLOWO2_01_FULL_45_59]OHA38631.1 MAG: glycine--tRNA ligase [Candidatus Taylorbacteria bacterium RIFCSPLOWO2_02_FULL_45_10b]OHA44394.1 MAG: glycine--tRNA ligase [Candidatus Taylorbacteria bacterium RIFCSPLOWO2_12_FULL_44_9]